VVCHTRILRVKLLSRAFDIRRFRYFDIGNFKFPDSDINSDITNIQNGDEIYKFCV
jgi:hypothetical protein